MFINKIKYIHDYTDVYMLSTSSKIKNISAIQMELSDEYLTTLSDVFFFFEKLNLDYSNLYLLTFKPIGSYFNKVHIYKKIWSNHSNTCNMQKGEEIRYDFRSGIVYASIAQINELNLKIGIDILMEYPLYSAIIYSDRKLIDYNIEKEIFDGVFIPLLDTIEDPEIIELDFQYLIRYFCKADNGVIRYANDGEGREIAFFVNQNSRFNCNYR